MLGWASILLGPRTLLCPSNVRAGGRAGGRADGRTGGRAGGGRAGGRAPEEKNVSQTKKACPRALFPTLGGRISEKKAPDLEAKNRVVAVRL